MTDRILPSPPVSPHTPPAGSGESPPSPPPAETGRQTVELIKVLEQGQKNAQAEADARASSVTGRVVRADSQTQQVILRTDRGQIEVQYPKDAPLPAPGTPVELKLPARPVSGQSLSLTSQSPSAASPVSLSSDSIALNTPQKIPAAYTPAPQQLSAQDLGAFYQPALQVGQSLRFAPLSPAQMSSLQFALLPGTALSIGSMQNIAQMLQQILPFPASGSLITSPSSFLRSQISFFPAASSFPPGSLLPSEGADGLQEVLQKFSLPAALRNPVFVMPSAPIKESAATLLQSFSTDAVEILPRSISFSSPPLLLQKSTPVFTFAAPPSLLPTGVKPTLHQMLAALPDMVHGTVAKPDHMFAQVVARTAVGQAVIALRGFSPSTLPALLVLQNVAADIGATFTLPVTDISDAALGVRLSGRPVPSMPLPGEWPDLEMALETLKTSGFPDLAAPMMQLIPSARTPAQIPPALLLFFMAVKGGDLSGWIGERPLDALKRLGKTDLINRLSSDFSTLSRLSSDTFGQDWRGMLFPFSGDLSLQMIAVFYKQDEHASQDHPGKKQTRFIFDMDLSRMGSVQIDGLFNSFEQVPRLEVMLRTEAPLSDGMKKMLRHSYAQAVKAVGISGELSFQGAAENFVTILEREEKVELTT